MRAGWMMTSVATAIVVAGACSEEAPTSPLVTASGVGAGSSQGGASGGAGGAGGSTFTASGGSSGCTSDADCGAGVCNEGTCCGSADEVCGALCCDGAGEVCLFESCVVPGDDCVSEADCGPDEYCEPALGEQSGSGGSMPGCTQPIEAGRCAPKPTVCTGEDTDPPDCIQPCEYMPPVGQLNAVEKWQWGYKNAPTQFVNSADVWSTPAVGRVYDANCDGSVDLADPPNVVFVSGNSQTTYCANNNVTNFACRKGVLRMLDGRSGEEIFSLDEAEAGSQGFAGTSVALGDVDNDQKTDVVALTGEGKVAVIDATGAVTHLSTEIVQGNTAGNYGWGGAISLGDMDNDGWTEIAYQRTVYTMKGGTLSQVFIGSGGGGGDRDGTGMSHFVDLDGDGDLELLAGNTAYDEQGNVVWQQASLNDGFTAVADFDGDMLPEVIHVRGGNLTILEGATGAIELGPHDIPGNGSGGPPTVADFNGDGEPEIGVAMQNFYTMMKPDYANDIIIDQWSTQNHDNSSSVTGSSVFDFQGDGKAEVVYMDECFLWVYDGTSGDILYTTNSQSFTATEASIVADVDGDGHAEIVVVHNAANPNNWSCAEHTTGTDGYPVWSTPPEGAYRGVTILGDAANSWVGTRTLWNQHAYNVTNICDPRDSACAPGSYYGQIPQNQQKNWNQSWLNNFRQNVQDGGLFDAPDVVVKLEAACASPVPLKVTVRNLGLAGLPAAVQVGIYQMPDTLLGSVFTTKPLLPGQSEVLEFSADAPTSGSFQARVIVDPNNVTFNECRPDNNASDSVEPDCVR